MCLIILWRRTTIFWARNKVAKHWYSIQGWREQKIWPDFIVGKKNANDELQCIYLLESKGEHLLGNDDSVYKNEIFKLMTEQSKKGKIEIYSSELKLTRINSSVEAHLIEDQKEEQQLKELMK